MIREEILKVWNQLKKKINLSSIKEAKEFKVEALKLRQATWKTLAYRVLLFRDKQAHKLDDIISLWEWDNYYKIKGSESHNFPLPEKEQVVVSWKVLTAKYLVVEERARTVLEEKLLSNSLVEEIKEKLKDYQEKQEGSKILDEKRQIGWKEEEE